MTHRPFRIEDSEGRVLLKRAAVLPETLPLSEAIDWMIENSRQGADVTLSRGAHVEWYTYETDGEREQREMAEAAADERRMQFERRMWDELHERYGHGGPPAL